MLHKVGVANITQLHQSVKKHISKIKSTGSRQRRFSNACYERGQCVMIEQLKAHVHSIFAPYQNVKSAQELEEELTQNLGEKFNDYKQKGYSDADAYRLTIDSIGEVSELVESINLQHSELEQAVQMNYSRQILRDSDFRSVTVHNGKFNYSDLKGSDFSHTDLTNSEFKSSNMHNCIFEDVNLTGTSFRSSALKGTTFENCTFDQAHFESCDLTGINFDGETFHQPIFESSALRKASFRDTTLHNVQFRMSDVKRVDFSGSKMDKLTYNFLNGAKADLSNVTLIEGGI